MVGLCSNILYLSEFARRSRRAVNMVGTVAKAFWQADFLYWGARFWKAPRTRSQIEELRTGAVCHAGGLEYSGRWIDDENTGGLGARLAYWCTLSVGNVGFRVTIGVECIVDVDYIQEVTVLLKSLIEVTEIFIASSIARATVPQ
jgi:hypothetical protein